MVLDFPFQCPVRVSQVEDFSQAVAKLVGTQRFALITSAGWPARGLMDRMTAAELRPAITVVDVPENPTAGYILRTAEQLEDCPIYVAVGGGSVLDSAKAFAACNGLGADRDEAVMTHLKTGAGLPATMNPPRIIAVPTTSGSGSEVTRWGTVWGDDGIKFSINDHRLYPAHALLDASLAVSMPRKLTLATGLDALSHAMEAIWNRRHSSLTDAIAEAAIRDLRRCLPAVLKQPDDLAARAAMQSVSTLAGLAMGTTQTAICHSISYPFTARHGVPHGLACSFTLAEVAAFNAQEAPDRLIPAARAFDCGPLDLADRLYEFFRELGLGEALYEYVGPDSVEGFGDALITRARAANNIREADGSDARKLARDALEKLDPR